jgi:hypothetical protein
VQIEQGGAGERRDFVESAVANVSGGGLRVGKGGSGREGDVWEVSGLRQSCTVYTEDIGAYS